MPRSATAALVGMQLQAAEEVADLERRRLRAVAAVDRVLLDVAREVLADRPRRRLRRIGRAHELPVLLDRALPFEDRDQNRSAGHELAQAREERALAVDVVEALGLRARE